jgi:hypothetical protein
MILTKNGNIVYSASLIHVYKQIFTFFLPFCGGLASELQQVIIISCKKIDNKISIWVSKSLMLIPNSSLKK